MSSHLEHVVKVGEFTRDRIRDELARYACETVLLDGVTAGRHTRVVVNTPYNVVFGQPPQPADTEQELLF